MSEQDIDAMIQEFNEKHDLTVDGQFRQLVEEVGELAEAINRDDHRSQVIGECMDVEFVARSICLLVKEVDRNCSEELEFVAEYNLDKSTETDGTKVTDDV